MKYWNWCPQWHTNLRRSLCTREQCWKRSTAVQAQCWRQPLHIQRTQRILAWEDLNEGGVGGKEVLLVHGSTVCLIQDRAGVRRLEGFSPLRAYTKTGRRVPSVYWRSCIKSWLQNRHMLFRLQYLCQAHWFRRYLQSKFVVDAIWFLWPFLVLAKSTYSKGNLCVKQPKEERDLLCCKDAGDWIFVWNLTQLSVTLEWYLDKQFKRSLSDLRFSFKLSFLKGRKRWHKVVG